MAGAAMMGGAVALASAIGGAIASSQANNKGRRLIDRQRDDNRQWYDMRTAQDYTMRPDVQAAIKRQREMLDEQLRRARKINVVAGGTDESLALQQQAANNSLSQTMTDVAGQAASYKDSVENRFRQEDANINQQQIQNYQQQAQNIAQAAGQAVNAGMSLVGNDIKSQSMNKIAQSVV